MLDPMEAAIEDFEKYGLEYAEAKAVSWHLQESKSAILSEEMKIHVNLPVNQREIIGRSSQRYKDHLTGTKEAIHKENKAKVLMEKSRMEFEMHRSKMSFEKAKTQIL